MMNEGFKDHFSKGAADYIRYRPTYPPSLFDWLASLTGSHDLAWDCGCGNGQAAVELVRHFRAVAATDPSSKQIDNAPLHERIRYAVAAAEDSGLDAGSVDLIVVAQALHWFDFDIFYDEARRVTRPGGVLAAISYGEVRVEGAPDAVVSRFYHETLGSSWPPERRYVDEKYATIPFPFEEIPSPPSSMEVDWDLDHLTGYLGTWSAVREYERREGINPLDTVAKELAASWGAPLVTRRISWPLSMRVGRI